MSLGTPTLVNDAELLALWQAAFAEDAGIKFKASDVTYCKMRLYGIRRKFPDARLMELSIITWPNKAEADLAIIHNSRAPKINPATNLAAINLSNLDLD